MSSCQYLNTTCDATVVGGVCTSGCTCSPGLVFNGTYCVEPSDCPCYANNVFYKPGSVWKENCSECICWENKVQCNKKTCSPVSYCPAPDYEITITNCCGICSPVSVMPTTVVPSTAIRCNFDEYHCYEADRCIPDSWLCDGSSDCTSDEDEKNCKYVLPCNDSIGKLKFSCFFRFFNFCCNCIGRQLYWTSLLPFS